MKHYKKLLFISSLNINSNTTIDTTPTELIQTQAIANETNIIRLMMRISDKYISNFFQILLDLIKHIYNFITYYFKLIMSIILIISSIIIVWQRKIILPKISQSFKDLIDDKKDDTPNYGSDEHNQNPYIRAQSKSIY